MKQTSAQPRLVMCAATWSMLDYPTPRRAWPALRQLAADATEPKATRVEASYHLASLANAAGQPDDVRKYADQVMQIDPTSPWTQRVFMLRASLPVAEAAPAAATPAVKLPGLGK